MTFTLSTSAYFYCDSDIKKDLEEIGFTFKKTELKDKEYYIQGSPEIEIDSLDELIKFSNKFGNIIINSYGTIEIYNDYRE